MMIVSKKTLGLMLFLAAVVLAALVGTRMFYREELGPFLEEAKKMLLSGVAIILSEKEETPEAIQVNLSDIFTEGLETETIGFKPGLLEEKPAISVKPTILVEPVRQMTLEEIQTEVNRIREKKEAIAQKVALLAAVEEQKAQKIAAIRIEIEAINGQIDGLSRQIIESVSV